MNYWKPYGNMRREKGVDIIDNRKQHEAQISYEINIRNTYPIDCP
jgi:hypothetical protein